MFGGLAYRQIHDNMELRRSGTGEDLVLYCSARAAVYLIMGAILIVPMALLCYGDGTPTVFRYALPLVMCAQLTQIALRLRFQRLRIRTRAIVVNRLFRAGFVVIPYEQLHTIHLKRTLIWTTLTIHFNGDQVQTFRIFRLSEGALLHKIGTMTGLNQQALISS